MSIEATPDERREFVLTALSERGRLSTTELSEHFGVSEDTARRDFREMAAEGLIKRVHGAALPVSPAALPFSGRYRIASDLKARLAKAAARLVLPNQLVVMDGGTSNLEVARHLPRDLSATIVTNSPQIATATSEHPLLEVILLGGVFDKRSQMTLGARVLDALRDVNADLCFIGVHGLNAELGLTTSEYDEATIKQAMMKSAAEVAAVVTPDKFGSAAGYRFGDLAMIDVLVTEDSLRVREWVTAAAFPGRVVYC